MHQSANAWLRHPWQATVLLLALLPGLPPSGGESVRTAHTHQTAASETTSAQLHASQEKLLALVFTQ